MGPDRQRLRQRRRLQTDAVGHAQRMTSTKPHILGICARQPGGHADDLAVPAQDAQTVLAVTQGAAGLALAQRHPDDAVADGPVRRAGLHHLAGEFVAKHGPGLQRSQALFGRVDV